jgi:hypothetical protein
MTYKTIKLHQIDQKETYWLNQISNQFLIFYLLNNPPIGFIFFVQMINKIFERSEDINSEKDVVI